MSDDIADRLGRKRMTRRRDRSTLGTVLAAVGVIGLATSAAAQAPVAAPVTFTVRVPASWGVRDVTWTLTTNGSTKTAYGSRLPVGEVNEQTISENRAGGARDSRVDVDATGRPLFGAGRFGRRNALGLRAAWLQ